MGKYYKDTGPKQSPIRKIENQRRTKVKKSGRIPENSIDGYVIASIGRIFLVRPKSDENVLYERTAGGIVISRNESASIVAVGDEVKFLPENYVSENALPCGQIHFVADRASKLARRMPGKNPVEHVIAANSDAVLVMASTLNPMINTKLIDRYLIAAELGELETAICINKKDLISDTDMDIFEEISEIYERMSIKTFLCSFKNEQGISDVFEFISGRSVVISGQSGVGKSTLINTFLGEDVQTVREISNKTAKGRHTTSFVRMFESERTKLIDTPGIREFGLWGIEPGELPLYFHDFDDFYLDCKFAPCSHTHEPKCAVKTAVEKGLISIERYESYLNILDSLVTNEF